MKLRNFLQALTFAASCVTIGHAAEVQFTAQLDREQITLDEAVSLKFSIRTEGAVPRVSSPIYSAPGLRQVNESTSNFTESYIDNGSFGVRNNQQITHILTPLKQGLTRITGIHVTVDGKDYKAPDLTVEVVAGGGATPPPRGYGSSGQGLRGSGKRPRSSPFFIRAETNKQKVYKGEQLIVSYYLLQKVRIFNLQADKYPTLSGFLREDLEMPILGQRLNYDRVILDGVPYEKALLVRYAAYPLREGKLSIDSMDIKANYYGSRAGFDDEDDPFMNFFKQMTPQVSSNRSEVIPIEVLPLPENGKPAGFSGAVGDFSVTAAIDKYEVRANEPVTLTLKIEGRGNLSSVEMPKSVWPAGVELYETKGRGKTDRSGISQKIFEVLLIPRSPGQVKLPPVEFNFFNPVSNAYVTRSSEAIDIKVLDPAPGSAIQLPPKTETPRTESADTPIAKPGDSTQSQLRGLKAPEVNGGKETSPVRWWRWLYVLTVLGLVVFGAIVGFDFLNQKRRKANSAENKLAQSKSWSQLKAKSKQPNSTWIEVTQNYELLTGALYDSIDRTYEISSRSYSREDLEPILVQQKGMSLELWRRASSLLEYAEMVRFASSAGAVSQDQARREFGRWVEQGEQLAAEMTKISK